MSEPLQGVLVGLPECPPVINNILFDRKKHSNRCLCTIDYTTKFLVVFKQPTIERLPFKQLSEERLSKLEGKVGRRLTSSSRRRDINPN